MNKKTKRILSGASTAALLTTAALLLIFRFVLKPDVEPLRKADVRAMQKALPESLRERCATASVGIFCGYCPCSLAKL